MNEYTESLCPPNVSEYKWPRKKRVDGYKSAKSSTRYGKMSRESIELPYTTM